MMAAMLGRKMMMMMMLFRLSDLLSLHFKTVLEFALLTKLSRGKAMYCTGVPITAL